MDHLVIAQHADGGRDVPSQEGDVLDVHTLADPGRQRLQQFHPQEQVVPDACFFGNDFMVFVCNDIGIALELMHCVDLIRDGPEHIVVIILG